VDVDPRLLRYFVAVSEDLHFSKASVRLGLTQPALSAAIRRLEAGFGVQLFTRSTRQVRLTPAGAALLPVVAETVAAQERLGLAVDRARADVPPIRIGTLGVFDTLRAIVAELGVIRPDVADVMQVDNLNSDEQIQALLRDEIDVGVGRVTAVPEGIDAELIRLDPMSAIVPADSALAGLPAVPAHKVIFNRPRRPEGQQSWETFVDRVVAHLVGAVVVDAGDGDIPVADVLLGRARREGLALMKLASFPPFGRGVVERPIEGGQPYFTWSLFTRGDDPDARIEAIRAGARQVAEAEGWLRPDAGRGEPWFPEDDLYTADLPRFRASWAEASAALAAAAAG
jgi:DNA-binding transcriptional LysR family regulator